MGKIQLHAILEHSDGHFLEFSVVLSPKIGIIRVCRFCKARESMLGGSDVSRVEQWGIVLPPVEL